MLRLPVRVIVLASLLHAAFPVGSTADDEASVPTSPSPPLAVTVADGLVSVDVRDVLLADVLRAVGDQAAVQVTIHSGGADRVTQSFAGIGLEEAIRRLAQGHDVVMVYGSSRNRAGAGRLVEVRVYEASRPGPPAVVDPQQRNARLSSMKNLIQQARQQQPGALASLTEMLTTDPDPAIRRSVAAALAGLRGPEAVAALTSALRDQDPSVRTTVVSSLGAMRDEALVPTVAQMLSQDPDASVRRAAAWALAGLSSDDAHRGLEAAASDPDASVRQAAIAALRQWERRARARPRAN